MDGECGQPLGMVEDLNWDGFDAMGGGVLFGPSGVEVGETGIDRAERR